MQLGKQGTGGRGDVASVMLIQKSCANIQSMWCVGFEGVLANTFGIL